jgi:subtilisin family serine protease
VDGTQWAHENDGRRSGVEDADIDASRAWETRTDAGSVIVAIVDSGIRYTHEDLDGNLWLNPGEISGNGVDDDGNGYVDDVHGVDATRQSGDPWDENGHGTHVAGIIGARGNNGVGVTGVAWNVQLMACRFMEADGRGVISDAIECIDYARRNGAAIINASFTGPDYSSLLKAALEEARQAGILVVTAAGNSATDIDNTPAYPAGYDLDNIVSVAATSSSDALATFSNYGAAAVDLAAPGVGIYSTGHGADDAYVTMSGTSMAAPMVAGALALLRAEWPEAEPGNLVRRLLAGADTLNGLAGKCVSGGRLNLGRAFDADVAAYSIEEGEFNWIDPVGMPELRLADNGVSAPVELPFEFSLHGRSYGALYVGANGVVGFGLAGLDRASNTTLPSVESPDAALYAYWDDLNPADGGSVHVGTVGEAPQRRVVITWLGVPLRSRPVTPLSFQVILEEATGRVQFQYLDVAPGRNFGAGRGATIGIEDGTGFTAALYSFNGSLPLTNLQSIVFVPPSERTEPPKQELELDIRFDPGISGVTLRLAGPSAQVVVLELSADLRDWVPVSTNQFSTAGTLEAQDITGLASSSRFYRLRSGP